MSYAKWAIVPLTVVITQVALNSVDAFSSQLVLWTFIAVASGILLYWHSRLRRVLLDPVLNDPPPKEFALLNRRFAMLAIFVPLFASLLAIIGIPLFVSLTGGLVADYRGTLWTITAIIAVCHRHVATAISLRILRRRAKQLAFEETRDA